MDTIEIMYKVIEIMANMKLPVVFKGAMVLKHIMITIKSAVNKLGIKELDIECRRLASANRSAGFVVNYQGQKLFSFDISLKTNPFTTEYVTDRGIIFTGASIEKIYADKLYAISSTQVLRRTKDIYDLYLLSQLNGYKINNIIRILEYQNRQLQDFHEFNTNIEDLSHAYSKLRNIINKTEFNIAYSRVRDFCLPFLTKDYLHCNGAWSAREGMWYQIG